MHLVWSGLVWSAFGLKCTWYEVSLGMKWLGMECTWYEVHLVWSTTWYEVAWYEVHLVWSALVWSVVVWSIFWDEVHRDEVTGMKWHFFPLVWSAKKNEVPVVWSVWDPYLSRHRLHKSWLVDFHIKNESDEFMWRVCVSKRVYFRRFEICVRALNVYLNAFSQFKHE